MTDKSVFESSDSVRHAKPLKYAQHATFDGPFHLERGRQLPSVTVAYETYGTLNPARDNAVLIFTGMSPSAHASSSPEDPSPGWWEEIVGPSRPIDTRRYFVICINSLGSCFGSTGPSSVDPLTGQPYRLHFPVLTLEDVANAGMLVVQDVQPGSPTEGQLQPGVYAKDLALWIIGMIGSDGANYMSVEYHGEGVRNLTVSDRMTLANLASEMGAKNAVFPADSVLMEFLGPDADNITGIWADEGAHYARRIDLNLDEIVPVVSAPHNVDNVKSVAEVAGTKVSEGLIGTCTNGRIEDLRIAAEILKGRKIKEGFQLNVIPASDIIFLQAINEGIASVLVESGASILPPSCGPCLGTGLGIPASGHTVISTANRNFKNRMGVGGEIYLSSVSTAAASALEGEITEPEVVV